MRHRWYVLVRMAVASSLTLAASGCVGAIEKAQIATSGELDVGSQRLIEIVVDGRTLHMTVDPGVGSRRLLNASVAARLGLRGSGIRGVYRIGPVDLVARSATADARLATSSGPLRFHWFEREVSASSDGLISPSVLPYGIVTFRLAATRPGETVTSLPFRGSGSYGWSGGEGVLDDAGEEIVIGFDPGRRETVASAQVGARLQGRLGGVFEGASRQIDVRYGVSRPARLLRLSSPFLVAGLAIDRMLVLGEGESGSASAPDEPVEADIVVNGGRRWQKPLVTIGSDALAGCSYLRFDKGRSVLELSCVSPARPDPNTVPTRSSR